MLHKSSIYLRPVTRIAIGFGFMTLAMLYASIIQHVIYQSGPCYKHPKHCGPDKIIYDPNEVNIWIQAPVYLFLALGEIFAWVTAIEYAYEQAPKHMKSVVQAISLLIAGMGSAVAMSLTPVARDPNMVFFYASLAGTMALTSVIFYCVFRNMEHDQYANEKKESHVESVMSLQEEANKASNAATRQSPLGLEPSSQSDHLYRISSNSSRNYETHPPSHVLNTNADVRHVRIKDPAPTKVDSSVETTESGFTSIDANNSSQGNDQTRHTRLPVPMPSRPSSTLCDSARSRSSSHDLDANETVSTMPNKDSRPVSSSYISGTGQSSEYDTADEYVPTDGAATLPKILKRRGG
jgi:hypothetical protein